MSKGKGLTFTLFAALGAIAGYATYIASKDEFSDETKEKVNAVLNKVRNVGNDIKRTYTSIGDKEEFETRTKNLSDSSMKLARKTGDLLLSGANDMYKYTKSQVSKAMEKYADDDTSGMNDDLDVNYVSTTCGKKKANKKAAKKTTKKSSTKKPTKKSKK